MRASIFPLALPLPEVSQVPCSLLLVPLGSLVPCCCWCCFSAGFALVMSVAAEITCPQCLPGGLGLSNAMLVGEIAQLRGVAGVECPAATAVWFSVAVYVAVTRRPESYALPLLLLLSSLVIRHHCSQGREPERGADATAVFFLPSLLLCLLELWTPLLRSQGEEHHPCSYPSSASLFRANPPSDVWLSQAS